MTDIWDDAFGNYEENKMTNSQDQQNAEKIAEFLGFEETTSNTDGRWWWYEDDYWNNNILIDWLASDDGTVTMKNKILADEMFLPLERCTEGFRIGVTGNEVSHPSLNATLQAAILELIGEK